MWRGDWSSEPAVQWTHEGQFGVAKITEKGNVTHDPILRPICQTILDLTLCDPKRRKELERLWRGLKPEFRPAVITTGNHGSFWSKGVAAGRGARVGDGLRKGGEMRMGY